MGIVGKKLEVEILRKFLRRVRLFRRIKVSVIEAVTYSF